MTVPDRAADRVRQAASERRNLLYSVARTMPPIRPALTLLATIVVLSPVATARATPPNLTPNPPVSLPDSTTTSTATTAEPTGAIPRTGDDLPEQLLVAGALIGAGAALRTRPLANQG